MNTITYLVQFSLQNKTAHCVTPPRSLHAPCIQQLRKPIASAVRLWARRAGRLRHRLHHQRFVQYRKRKTRDFSILTAALVGPLRYCFVGGADGVGGGCLVLAALVSCVQSLAHPAADPSRPLVLLRKKIENQLKLVVTSKNRQTDRFVGKIREFFDNVFNTYSPMQVRGLIVCRPVSCTFVYEVCVLLSFLCRPY